jgi:pheromone shutdown-related protein TraB
MQQPFSVEHIEDNVDCISWGNKKIFLVGTAHISLESVELADEVIRREQPDSVAVELCASRADSIRDPNRWKSMDLISVIKAGRAYVLLAQLVLSGFQKKLGEQLEVKPGAEMLKALETADELHIPIVLADRDVRTTLKRTWNSLSFFATFEIVLAMIASVFTKEEIDKTEIERLKKSDVLEEALKEFSDRFPTIKAPLIDERDLYLTEKIRQAPGQSVVAIVGAGHVPGIIRNFEAAIDLAALEEIPPRPAYWKIVGWMIPILVLGLFVYGFIAGGLTEGLSLFEAWFWINASLAGLGALLALAHPLTILVAFLASPFTSLNPMIGVGWVAALVEASLRKPRVGDFESLGLDVMSFKGLYRNRISRVLLVFMYSSLLGALGTFLGGFEVFRRVIGI